MLTGLDAPAKTPRSVLFICGMNAVRSPVAELLARQVLPATTFVASAGVRAGERDPFVDAVLAEGGLSLKDRQPRTIDDLEDDYFDLIVTLAPEAHHAALELTRSMAVTLNTGRPPIRRRSLERASRSWRPIAICATGSRHRIAARFGL